jgi:hypothetical protein
MWPSVFITEIQRILKKYCYSLTYAVNPIPIPTLIQELRYLNTLHPAHPDNHRLSPHK